MKAMTSIHVAALALLSLSALSIPAHADVYVDKLNTPSQQMGLPASDTALQFHVVNSGSRAANNNKIKISLQTWSEGPTGKVFTLTSSMFNLAAYQQEWITVMIPAAEYGKNLKGQELKGKAGLGSHSYYLDFNDNGAYNPWPPVLPAHLQISAVKAPTQQKNNAIFTITVTNTGGEASQAETLSVIEQPWSDGPDGPAYKSSVTLPALLPGESKTAQFEAVDYNSDELKVDIYLNQTFQQEADFWG